MVVLQPGMTYRKCVAGSAIFPPRSGFPDIGRFYPVGARGAQWRSSLLSLLTLLVLLPGARAQRDPVWVTDVSFGRERLAATDEDWFEAAIEILGGRNTEPGARNPRFVDHVRVVLSLSFRVAQTGPSGLSFYRSEVDIPTLKQGQKRTVFFYLPPEVVERDRLRDDPLAYLVALEIDGRALPLRRANVSTSLRDAARVQNFEVLLASQAQSTAGILRPLFQTPFYGARDKLNESPSFVRKPE